MTLKKEGDVTSIVSKLNLESLQGASSELMKIAHVIKRFGSFSVALDYGYRLLRKHENIPEVELLYCGLLLGGSEVGSDLLSRELVCDGMWIKIVDQDAKSDEFVIDSSELPSAKIVRPNDDRARQFIGKKIGETVEIERPLIGPRIWKIQEIKHRYLHALHEIMGTFNNRFPGHRGLQEILIQDNNFQILLDVLKSRSEKADSLGHAYESSKVPIALIGATAGGETIGFLEFLEARPDGIRTCYGAGEEHRQGLRFVEASKGRGAVLDITALWTALRLDALPILSRVFGSIMVSNSTVNEIREIREQRFQDLGRQVGTLAYKDGRCLSSGFNNGHTSEQFEIIDGYLAQVESLTIAPAVISHGLRGPLVDILTADPHPHLIDPILVSVGSQAILISEDVDFRKVCMELTRKQSVWLQPVFRYALAVGILSEAVYSVLMEKLIGLGHGHVSIDAQTLIAIAEKRPLSMPVFAKLIGGKDAEIKSHVAVVTAFAKNYWTGDAVPNPVQKAMKVLLLNLVRFRESERDMILATIAVTACDDDGLLRFVVQWAMNRRWKTRALKRLAAQLRVHRRI
jgi:hypothetical protein